MMKTYLTLFILLALTVPSFVMARVGVGVAAGKIQVDEPLKPGGIYGLPIVPVLNTGDEPGDYGFSIEYLEYQDEQKPPREWFRFDPETFALDPGSVQDIQIKLQLPVDARPGKYFAFLEAHPISINENGETAVKIAAASKLYFEVAPANIWQGLYYRTVSLFNQNAPWSYIGLAVLCLLVVIALIRKFFTFNVRIGRRDNL